MRIDWILARTQNESRVTVMRTQHRVEAGEKDELFNHDLIRISRRSGQEFAVDGSGPQIGDYNPVVDWNS